MQFFRLNFFAEHVKNTTKHHFNWSGSLTFLPDPILNPNPNSTLTLE